MYFVLGTDSRTKHPWTGEEWCIDKDAVRTFLLAALALPGI